MKKSDLIAMIKGTPVFRAEFVLTREVVVFGISYPKGTRVYATDYDGTYRIVCAPYSDNATEDCRRMKLRDRLTTGIPASALKFHKYECVS